MDGMIMSLDENGKITGWLGKGGRDIADSVNAKVLKLEHD
jgi:hypothetical protein